MLINQRFELSFFFNNKINNIIDYNNYNNILHSSINTILSQITSVNNQIHDLKKLNIVRLYLIKSYKGKAHAIGKPVKGQRT
jgi:ribosomal protein S13